MKYLLSEWKTLQMALNQYLVVISNNIIKIVRFYIPT